MTMMISRGQKTRIAPEINVGFVAVHLAANENARQTEMDPLSNASHLNDAAMPVVIASMILLKIHAAIAYRKSNARRFVMPTKK